MRICLYVLLVTIAVYIVGCDSSQKIESTSEVPEATTQSTNSNSIPDPHGEYSDAEGGLSITFLATGKFYQDLLGETLFGTWVRTGDEIELTYDDGSSTAIELGDDYVTYNGMRLSK